MGIKVKEMTIGQHQIQLILEENKASVKIDGKTFERLDILVKTYSELSDPQRIEDIAVIANFMFSHLKYEVIKDPAKFRRDYAKRLEADPRVKKYGVFELSNITRPQVNDKEAIFFVEDLSKGIPLQVTCPFPYTNPDLPFAYQMLPYKST
jgi:hypothetical protein